MRRAMAVWIVTSVFLLGVSSLAAADKAQQIDALVRQYAELGQFGGAVLVAENGKVILEKGYGLANMEWGVPNAPDTRFRLGSITKQFTAAVIMQLVEEGRLSLDARLVDVLPGYRKDTGEKVTVRHLLNHTSGIPSYTSDPRFRPEVSRNPYTVSDMVSKLCSGDLQFEPGGTFTYNNCGYVLLGAIIERLDGRPYEAALKARVLDRLGMADTGYDRSRPILPRRAQGYERTPDGLVNASYIDMSLPYAAGALYSTVRDLYTWDQALYGETVLSAQAKEQMFTPGLGSYGFGWGITKKPIGPGKSERTVISHGGGIDGFSSHISRVPADRHLVVLLNNGGSSRLEGLSNGIWDVLYGRTPPVPRRPIGEVLGAVALKDGAEAAIARYRELKEREADRFDFHERELNLLGYRLLAAGKADAAVEILRLNAELFPESSNTHDSLGEGLAAAGKKDEAIKEYARSLQLDPGNLNAVEALVKLTKR